MEEQKSVASKVSCSPKPLDTTTQESSYSEKLKQSIDGRWQLTLKGKKIDGNDLFNLLSEVLKMHHVNFARIVELQDMYREIIQEDMKFAREDALDFNAQLKNLVVDDRVCNIFSEQFELHFRLSECYNDADIGKLLKDDDIKFVLDMIPGISAGGSEDWYQRYQRILQEKDMAVAEEAASAFND